LTVPGFAKDLIVVTADSQIHRTVEILVNHRRRSLALREFSADVVRHPGQDSGCRANPGRMLDPHRNSHAKAMVIFDFHGCGERRLSPQDLETRLENDFARRGWGPDRVSFVVIEPELEAWLFGASYRHLESEVSWSRSVGIQRWLTELGYLQTGTVKPSNPQAAFEAVLYEQKLPRSADLFANLAQRVSLARCQDRAFQKFRSTLQRWFPAP